MLPLLKNALHRGIVPSIKIASSRLANFFRTGYLHTGERVCPDFPNEVFKNHEKVYKFLLQFAAGRTNVLEIGCGTGYGTHLLAGVAQHVEAIDQSKQAIKYARHNYSRSNVQHQVMTAERLSFPSDSFDMAISSEVFEHLQDHEAHIKEVARVLTPEGLCFIATPDPARSEGHNEFHTKEFPPEEMRDLMLRHFAAVEIIPAMHSGPVTVFGEKVNTEHLHNTHSFFVFGSGKK
jgi:2-polyprenyl-3-methyl-5-hydroxy-6-metoxy-1,4-benzoquinol methylase